MYLVTLVSTVRWRFGLVVARWSRSTKLLYAGPIVSTRMGDRSGVRLSMSKPISVYNQPPRSTRPGHPSVGKFNEYQPKGGNAMRLESMVGVWVASKTVWSLSSHGPYLRALEMRFFIIRRYTNRPYFTFLLLDIRKMHLDTKTKFTGLGCQMSEP